MVWLLIVLILCALLFGGYGESHSWRPYYSWSPVSLLILLLLVLLLMGAIRI